MAKAMDTLDVIKALLNGGCIVECCPQVYGAAKYKVQIPNGLISGTNKTIGHITRKQFEQLLRHDILSYTRGEVLGKDQKMYCWYDLCFRVKELDD